MRLGGGGGGGEINERSHFEAPHFVMDREIINHYPTLPCPFPTLVLSPASPYVTYRSSMYLLTRSAPPAAPWKSFAAACAYDDELLLLRVSHADTQQCCGMCMSFLLLESSSPWMAQLRSSNSTCLRKAGR